MTANGKYPNTNLENCTEKKIKQLYVKFVTTELNTNNWNKASCYGSNTVTLISLSHTR